jgi:hypothetical protein
MRQQNRKLKVMIARWLAHRIEMRTRRLRRSLRDYDRIQWHRIHAADHCARGLRLYAAWSFKENAATHCGKNCATGAPVARGAAGEWKVGLEHVLRAPAQNIFAGDRIFSPPSLRNRYPPLRLSPS